MLERQRSGSVVCPTCGRLVGVQEPTCPHCGRSNPGMFGYARTLGRIADGDGFVKVVIGTCVVLYVLTLLVRPGEIGFGGLLGMLEPDDEALFVFGASGSIPVFEYDRWWTVISASWLHGGLLHILFNMMWIRSLAPPVARFFGPGRMILIYLISGVAGFAMTSGARFLVPGGVPILGGAHFTVGASAAIFGLLGGLVLYGRATGSSALSRQVWTWALVLFVFGVVMPRVDNIAHLGGFLGGYVAAMVLDPREPEKPEHLLAAVAGLAISLLALVGSVVSGLALL